MLEILSIFNLVIGVQAIFVTVHFLLKSKGTAYINKLLAALCASFGLIVLNTYLNLIDSGISLVQDVSNNILWFVGPLFYLLVAFYEKPPSRSVILKHTLPYLLPATIIVIFKWDWLVNSAPFLGFSQMLIYLILVIRHSLNLRKTANAYFVWIMPAVLTFSLLIVLNSILLVLGSFGITLLPNAITQSFTTVLAIPIYYIAYKEMNATKSLSPKRDKYSTSPLSDEKAAMYLEKIERAMANDRLFTKPSLTLRDLADFVEISPKYISQVVNKELNLNFAEYVLRFRLEDVKRELKNPDKQHLTIHSIAQESGFNSNSRFNYLFKKHVRLTPKQFQDRKQQQ